MKFVRHSIPDVVELIPDKFGDNRGFFSEVFKRTAFEEEGIVIDWVQDNQSFSAFAGTVRGLHFQAPPVAQHKLIRVLRGSIYDVALDIRAGSPTFGEHVAVELSADKWNQLLVPFGFAHCFMTMEPYTEVLYKVSDYWSRDHEGAIRWDDPALGIMWPELGQSPTLSEKDAAAPFFADFETPFEYRADDS